jgi:SAM-dependent methyltransferase
MSEFKYVGSELDLFAGVLNWNAYWAGQVRPFLGGDVLEVGAGIGANTRFLDPDGGNGRWVCLEPDPELFRQLVLSLQGRKPSSEHPRKYEPVCGTMAALGDQQFDAIVYIDVLEHIEHDREELEQAASRLRSGGHLIVLSPAHQRLFSPFDASIGHFRRYDRPMMRSISPGSLRLTKLIYLDSAGLLLSMANSLLLRQSMPTKAQLHIWDSWVIPVSRVLDGCLFHSVGKTIVGIWRREPE